MIFFEPTRVLLAATIFAVGLSSANAAGGIKATPLAPSSKSTSDTRFELLTPAASGIDFVQPIDTNHYRKYLYVGGYASPGVAIGDLDGDDRQDIFLSGGPVPNRLYLQTDKDCKFRDATADAKVLDGGPAWSAGATLVDIDRDGDLDIYVCNYDSPNHLFVNESQPGKVRFVERAAEYGLDIVDASFMSAFCDYDLDGDLDVFVVGYQYVDPSGRPKDPPVVQQNGQYYVKQGYRKYYGIVLGASGKPIFTNVGREDYLFENKSETGKTKFENVTKKAGIEGLGIGNSAVWWDFNQDGLPDIYVANDFKVSDQLLRNNGDGTFTDVIRQSFSHTTWFSMGSEVGDINNDGLIDLFVSDMAGTTHYRSKVSMGEMGTSKIFMKISEPRQMMRNAMLINTGTPRFLESAFLSHLANSDWSWAVKLADFDNDGMQDVVITNGAARMFNHSDHTHTVKEKIGKTYWDLWEGTPTRKEENLAFRNEGHLHFKEVGNEWGLRRASMSYSAAYGDLDNDGDLDLVVSNLEEPVSVYRNHTSDAHRIRLRLVGNKDRYGTNAVVTIETDKGLQTRQQTPSMGFLSCNDPFVHFGLGDQTTVNRLTVKWPSGHEQTFRNLPADQLFTVTEPDSKPPQNPPATKPNTMFVASNAGLPKHEEVEYDDFRRQPLLPFKHSQLGPGIAMADIDADGDLDVYVAQGKGSSGGVFRNDGRGGFAAGMDDAFDLDDKYEDMGVLFFDADADGDNDLYAVSGSVECEPNDPSLQDRLYLNDGNGSFTKAPDSALPKAYDSGSIACAADYDHDGDLDLFVGGRVVPGKFPVVPNSHLLKNESSGQGPRFTNVTKSVAPGLAQTGLVTSAVWSDVDNDGWVDLVIAHDWGPVKLFHNEPATSGTRKLVDQTTAVGLSGRVGWWNGIAADDIDNDGDMDFVVTNFGLNTKYHASSDKPELLYYGDFDGTGKPHLVEAKFEKEKCFPRRGLSCSSHAMPFVRKKMGTFHNFGLATLTDIYTENKLNDSLQLEANELQSGTLVNISNGDGKLPRFEFHSLPTLAQISPGFGVNLADFDADGHSDCFIAQNFFTPQIETARMDSGLSLLLHGGGTTDSPEFDEVWPASSGISIPYDAKASAVGDLTGDGWADLLVTVNARNIAAFKLQPTQNKVLAVKLAGKGGNRDCVGARARLIFEDGHSSGAKEVRAGGGYLSQSSATLHFGCGKKLPKRVEIRWPRGKISTKNVDSGMNVVSISEPN